MSNFCIRGAIVIDGTGVPGQIQDVQVRADRIVAVGPDLPVPSGCRVVDGRERILAPGFIDIHSHGDVACLSSRNAKLLQGITTEVAGNCGLSAAPVAHSLQASWRGLYGNILGGPADPWPWETVSEYLDCVEAETPSTNVALLAGYGAIRLSLGGFQGDLTSHREALPAALSAALEQGAIGISLGLSYSPCSSAEAWELQAVARALARHDALLAVHLRSEGDHLLESIDEMVALAEAEGIRLQISHLKASDPANWHKAPDALRQLEEAAARGVHVGFDQYPYNSGSTALSSLLPSWMHEGGVGGMRDLLGRRDVRERLRGEIQRGLLPCERHFERQGWDAISVIGLPPERADWEGRRLGDLARSAGSDPLDLTCDLLADPRGTPGMILHTQDEGVVQRILVHPLGTAGTDGLNDARPHPRATSAFPRLLGRYVRELRLLSWEAAIHRMSGRSARVLGWTDRGVIRAGAFADLVLLDPDTVSEVATFADPWIPPRGIDLVVVNGEMVAEGGEFTGTRAGRVIRGVSRAHGSSAPRPD